MSNGSGNSVSRTSPSRNLTESAHPQLSRSLERDIDHLFGQVDAGDLGAVGFGQVEGGAADAAADVEHAHARPQRRAEARAQVVRGGGAAGADVVLAEDHLVAQDARCGCIDPDCRISEARPKPFASLS